MAHDTLPAMITISRSTEQQDEPLLRSALRRGFLLLLIFSSFSATAFGADLPEDTRRIQAAWIEGSLSVTKLAPVFLEADRQLPIRLPSWAITTDGKDCTTVGVIGTRATDFSIELHADGLSVVKGSDNEGTQKKSVSGLASITKCAEARRELTDLTLHMKSARGTLEILVSRGQRAAPPLEALLPERATGTQPAQDNLGPPPRTADMASRVTATERQILGARGLLVDRQLLPSDSQGRGNATIRVEEGCYQFSVIADTTRGAFQVPADLDVELKQGPKIISRDRGNATDGTADGCFGEPGAASLSWAGSPPSASVTLVQGRWPVPVGIPREWDARVRGNLAKAHRRRQTPLLVQGPEWSGAGLTGRTSVSVELAPDACYALAAGVQRGDARALGITARVGPRFATDTGGGAYEGSVVTFCAQGETRATLDFQAIGSNVAWLGGLWKIGTMPLGIEESR